MPSIRTFYLVTVHKIDSWSKCPQQIVYLSYVVLTVTVGIEDEVLFRARESRDQRGAVSEIALVVDDAQERQFSTQRLEDFSRLVPASVVDNKNLEIISHRSDFGSSSSYD